MLKGKRRENRRRREEGGEEEYGKELKLEDEG